MEVDQLMKKIFSVTSLMLVFAVFSFAQKPEAGTAPESRQSAQSAGINAGTSIDAQLQQNLDLRSAKVGDQIVLKTTKAIKQNGRTVVEKGSKIVGRVSDIQQRTKENAVSRIGLVFERIQGKNVDLPITASIVSMTRATTPAGTAESDLFADSAAPVRTSSSSSGGSLLGTAGGIAGGVVNTASNAVGTVANTAGNTVSSAKNTAGGATQTLGSTVKGINISTSADASAQGSTILSTQNKNLRVEKGTNFQLRVNGAVNN